MIRWLLAATALTLAACTTLGPMPATTALSAAPAGRPGVETQVGIVPGYYLSSSVTDDPKGTGMLQGSVMVEPDRVLEVPGLLLGARVFGEDSDVTFEPIIGYRRMLAERVAVAAFIFGTRASGSEDGASYEAIRAGGELATDIQVTPTNEWAELHLFGGAAVTSVRADGTYCSNAGLGVDCDGTGGQMMEMAELSGLYPALHVGVAGHLFRRSGALHGVRLAGMVAAGTMPTVFAGEQGEAEAYLTIGLTLSVGLGASAVAP